jgi:hypothetical protein
MPTIVPPPISTVEAETHGIEIQGIKIQGIATQWIEIQGIEIHGIEIKGTWTSANPWHPAVTLPAATGIEITKTRDQKSAAVPRAPRIPGTMAPECLDVTALC